MPDLILASHSPRRAELLREAGFSFTVSGSDVDERAVQGDTPAALAEKLALAKAETVARANPNAVVLGADTLGILDGHILHKPESVEDARRMLTTMRGKTHQILTGYALVVAAQKVSVVGHVVSEVRMRAFTNEELEAYLATDEPYDKAGGYAVQGEGRRLVALTRGDYSNMVGLPMATVARELAHLGVVPRLTRAAMPGPVTAILFDADGTLVDTTELIECGFQETLRTNGFEDLARPEYIRACIGGTVADTFARILTCTEDDPRIMPLVAAHDVVQDGHPEWIRAYPNTRETLAALKKKGIRVGLVTSGSMYHVERNFRAVGIEPHDTFDTIVCADDHVASKPSPEGLLLACSRLGIEPSTAVFVGDHGVDMQAAQNAQLACGIGISHGFHTEEELRDAGARTVIHALPKLLEVLALPSGSEQRTAASARTTYEE